MLTKTDYTCDEIKNWTSLVEKYQKHQNEVGEGKKRWIFRGQRVHKGRKSATCLDPVALATSLERVACTFGLDADNRNWHEKWLLKEFRRRLHHYVSNTPEQGDIVEWLALMQHYGAPTRLHDWTYSFFIACYFAVERAQGDSCEVWAMDVNHFNAKKVLGPKSKSYKTVEKAAECNRKKSEKQSSSKISDELRWIQNATVDFLMANPTPLVLPVNPFRLNERLTIQQGVFLFPGDITKPLEDNITASQYAEQSRESLFRYKIPPDIEQQKEVLKHLYRMNIDRATLFPGLGGFAESLMTRLGFLYDLTDSP